MQELIDLHDNVHFAWTGDDIVALDVGRDLYICLVGAAAAVTRAGPRQVRIGIPEVQSALVDAGLVQNLPTATLAWSAVKPLTAISPFDVPDDWRGLGFLMSGVRSSRQFHGRALGDLIENVRRLRRGPTRPPVMSVYSAVSAYRSGLPWTPRQGLCLHRSFMLLHFLHEQGLRADWVFGVRTWPFAAHCWVQIGDRVVGDDLHRVLRYAPILVV